MATVTRKDHCIVYEVFVNGERKWITTVFFGRSKATRVGGAAFRQAAAEQERQAEKFLGRSA